MRYVVIQNSLLKRIAVFFKTAFMKLLGFSVFSCSSKYSSYMLTVMRRRVETSFDIIAFDFFFLFVLEKKILCLYTDTAYNLTRSFCSYAPLPD